MSFAAMARSFEVLVKPTLQFRNFIECFLMLGWHLKRDLKHVNLFELSISRCAVSKISCGMDWHVVTCLEFVL